MPHIFVYGTLMRGQENAHFLAGARLVGASRTKPRYTLLHLGDYPGMREGGTTSVLGEVYEIDGDVLALLDELEGHPELFRRGSIELLGGGSAIAYLLAAAAVGRRIVSGDWRRG